jgi:ATP-dependent DNA helicase RecG
VQSVEKAEIGALGMTPEHIKKLLAEGEGLTIEYKECVDGLNNSIWETVCSFSNRYGGHLIIGARDDGTPIGVNRNAVQQMKKNFVNMLNNPQKASPSLFLSLEEVELDGKLLLHVYVPISSQIQSCSGRIFDRNEDGDFNITNSSELVGQLSVRKSNQYTEREIFPYVTESELRLDLVERAKKMAVTNVSDHPWGNMEPTEIFRSAGLYEDDWRTGKKGFNLAAILLFGCDDVIRSCAPGCMTDALLRRTNTDRYDDRLMVETNLIEAYDQLVGFISKHSSDPFCLIGDQRVSVRSWISRELVSNILVHREYSKAFTAKLIIEKSRIYAENWNRSNVRGRLDPEDFTPESKNPLISKFFVNIARADNLGSGIRNLYKYTKLYSGGEPELIEGDVFKTIIPLSATGDGFTTTVDFADVEENVADVAERPTERIVTMLRQNPEITGLEIADRLSLSRRTVQRYLKTLKDSGVIVRNGSDRAGRWIVK